MRSARKLLALLLVVTVTLSLMGLTVLAGAQEQDMSMEQSDLTASPDEPPAADAATEDETAQTDVPTEGEPPATDETAQTDTSAEPETPATDETAQTDTSAEGEPPAADETTPDSAPIEGETTQTDTSAEPEPPTTDETTQSSDPAEGETAQTDTSTEPEAPATDETTQTDIPAASETPTTDPVEGVTDPVTPPETVEPVENVEVVEPLPTEVAIDLTAGALTITTDGYAHGDTVDGSADVSRFVVTGDTTHTIALGSADAPLARDVTLVLAGAQIGADPTLDPEQAAPALYANVDAGYTVTLVLQDEADNVLCGGAGHAAIEAHGQGALVLTCEQADERGHTCADTCGQLRATGGATLVDIGGTNVQLAGGRIQAILGGLPQADGTLGRATVTMTGGVLTGRALLGTGSSFDMNGGTIADYAVPADATYPNGGAIYAENSTITLRSGTIARCNAPNGGAIYAENSTVALYGGTIESCNATAADGRLICGGQVDIYGGDIAAEVIAATTLTDHRASELIDLAAVPETLAEPAVSTPDFIITIPSQVTLDATGSASQLMIDLQNSQGRTLALSVVSANGLKLKLADAVNDGAEGTMLGYTVTVGEVNDQTNAVALTTSSQNELTGSVTGSETAESEHFVLSITPETPRYAGSYHDTLTFTAAWQSSADGSPAQDEGR
ncbi:MAG: hypothetical protein Q4D31_02420 [Eubacteriales bacterium]|nr:hypothetical protein [Eubacteriales bacterium]